MASSLFQYLALVALGLNLVLGEEFPELRLNSDIGWKFQPATAPRTYERLVDGASSTRRDLLLLDDDDILIEEGVAHDVLAESVDSSKLRSTGTTIAGICGRDFVVLGADTRATNGQMVADNRCYKIHKLADNVYACGAGTSADLEHLTRQILFRNKMFALKHSTIGNAANRPDGNVQNVARVCDDIQGVLYKQGGSCSANLVVGGVYQGEAILRAIHPHGSQDAVAFTALGSGGLAAMGALEQSYNENMTMEEAKDLVTRAIRAGIINDLGSGSQVDLCIITSSGTEMIRCHVPEDELDAIQDVKRPDQPGVNGFGNHAFVLRKVRRLTESVSRTALDDQWYGILGSDR